jgi:hypothetical protein
MRPSRTRLPFAAHPFPCAAWRARNGTADDHVPLLNFRDGTRYTYSGIAPNLYRELLRAASKGSFFNRHIRGHFPYAKTVPEN